VTEEAISIDPDYSTRQGYQAEFLGKGEKAVPLPQLSDSQRKYAARNQQAGDGGDPHVLEYHHFSVVMNRLRRLAFFTAVNIDGTSHKNPKRETDKWFFDPRIAKSEQMGNEVYASNPLDRGHLVRRLDPAWGSSAKVAKTANDDTFHWTNCSPQEERFNQGSSLWAGLEDYILNNAVAADMKVSVFTGPIFRKNDPRYRGVQIPAEYWKVAVIAKPNGTLSATAYVVSQDDLIGDLTEEEFIYGAYRTFQVPVKRVEKLTGLSFGKLAKADPLAAGPGVNEAAFESGAAGIRRLGSQSDIVL
jgi:endonuclease G